MKLFFSHEFSGINGIFLFQFFYGIPIYWVTQFTYFFLYIRTCKICIFIYNKKFNPFLLSYFDFSFFYFILFYLFFWFARKKYFVGLFISLHFHMYIYPLLLPPTSNILSRYILKVLFSLRSYFSFWLFHAKIFNSELRNFFLLISKFFFSLDFLKQLFCVIILN